MNNPTERFKLIDPAIQAWINRLIDKSRRNNLLYFRNLKLGTLDLEGYHSGRLSDLLSGESILLSELLPNADATITAAKLREINRCAISNREEKGLETLFLATGMATWPSSDGGSPSESPIIMVPISMQPQGREGKDHKLQKTGDIQMNLVLFTVLEESFGIRVDPDSILSEPENGERVDVEEAFARLKVTAKEIQGFEIKPRAVIGNFTFQKMAMVRDLRQYRDQIGAHDLIAAIAGCQDAREGLVSRQLSLDPKELDTLNPSTEFLVLDSDSSQGIAVQSILREQDGVIHGPPGTGKSQTIANLIGALVATGKKVLFVAQKRAALEVVFNRMKEKKLEHLVLDLHQADVSRKDVMSKVAHALATVRESPKIDDEKVNRTFVQKRSRLNEQTALIHKCREPANLSLFSLQGRLLRLPIEAKLAVRWQDGELLSLITEKIDLAKDLLAEAAGFEGLFYRDDSSAWVGTAMKDGNAVRDAILTVGLIKSQTLPHLRSALKSIVDETLISTPEKMENIATVIDLLTELEAFLLNYNVEFFQLDLVSLRTFLAVPKDSSWSVAWTWFRNPKFRNARRQMRKARRGIKAMARVYLADVDRALQISQKWVNHSKKSVRPASKSSLENLRHRFLEGTKALEKLRNLIGPEKKLDLSIGAIEIIIDALSQDPETPYRIPRLAEIEQELIDLGVQAFVVAIRTMPRPSRELLVQKFEYAWLQSCFEQARRDDPSIASFDRDLQDSLVKEFGAWDKERLRVAAGRVRRAHAEKALAAMNAHPDQTALVRRESEKKARHLPMRKLLSQASDVLLAVCPCWMASPLTVSNLLAGDKTYFDVVLFDEASQVLPEDAIPSILRGSHTVVAGDKRQLPPTTFFTSTDEEEEVEDSPLATEGFESILDVMNSFLQGWHLNWHYRSLDESLIAFSNRWVYGDRLVTFPNPRHNNAISHVHIESSNGADGDEPSSSAEVRKVVELILRYAEDRPEETLGVIALGIKHSQRIQAALDVELPKHPDLDAYFDQNKHERFFIKNLERVQGDERDGIILSIGYGKDRSGHLPYRFGPLLYTGGERRLNVAITRARRSLTVVSGFTHMDMDPQRSNALGVKLLREYLQYASTGGKILGDIGGADVPLNDFEQDIYDALVAKGIPLIPQYGASQYRIDLVAQHRDKPGQYVMAIECDGARYHSSPTARDRDRLRQQHLEALGWKFHRIWSTEWFLHKDKEVDRALRVYEQALVNLAKEDENLNARAPRDKPEPKSTKFELKSRSKRPYIAKHSSIDKYDEYELIEIVRWINSDDKLRTDEEIADEMIQELGFKRHGIKIDTHIRRAIDGFRSR